MPPHDRKGYFLPTREDGFSPQIKTRPSHVCSYTLQKGGWKGGEGASLRRLGQCTRSSRSWHASGRPPRQQCKNAPHAARPPPALSE